MRDRYRPSTRRATRPSCGSATMSPVRDFLIITAVFLGLVMAAMALSLPAWRLVESRPGNELWFWVAVLWTLAVYVVAATAAMKLLALYRHRITSDGRNQKS